MMQTVGSFVKDKTKIAIDHRSYVSLDVLGFGVQKVINNELSLKAKELNIEWLYYFVGVSNTALVNNCMKAFDEWRFVYHVTIELPFF